MRVRLANRFSRFPSAPKTAKAVPVTTASPTSLKRGVNESGVQLLLFSLAHPFRVFCIFRGLLFSHQSQFAFNLLERLG